MLPRPIFLAICLLMTTLFSWAALDRSERGRCYLMWAIAGLWAGVSVSYLFFV